jgi:hypothetical protein
MRSITALGLLGLSACVSNLDYRWDPTQPKGKRPFKAWVTMIESLDPQAQVEAVERLSWILDTRTFSEANGKRIPHWGDLVEELSRKGKVELLYSVLSRKRTPWGHFEELAVGFSKELDERAMRLLERTLEYERAVDDLFRRSAVWALGNFCWNPSFARILSNRLIPLALEDPDATTRAFAVRALGIGAQPDAVPILLTALQDRGPVREPNGGLQLDSVGKWASEALEMIERTTGKPVLRDTVGQ